jgi:hypothetical protein
MNKNIDVKEVKKLKDKKLNAVKDNELVKK